MTFNVIAPAQASVRIGVLELEAADPWRTPWVTSWTFLSLLVVIRVLDVVLVLRSCVLSAQCR